ncbi:MAG: cell wall-binding repeat-containing protein [Desulfitobacteriaceae bacterium]
MADTVILANAYSFPDALVAGAFAAHFLSPILMVDQGVPSSTSPFLSTNKASISDLTEIGGEGVITPNQDTLLRGSLH